MKTKPSIALVGAGKVATHLAQALQSAGFSLSGISSREKSSAAVLAQKVGCEAFPFPKIPKADLILVCVADDALPEVAAQLKDFEGMAAHTSGYQPLDIWEGLPKRGIFYPLQSFSKTEPVNWAQVPLFLEATDDTTAQTLKTVAKAISTQIHFLSSEKRQWLHVAAVFANNFTNLMYREAEKICLEHGLPFESLLPLIRLTAEKINSTSPEKVQTGPAQRGDKQLIEKHLSLLTDPDQKKIYELLTDRILNRK